MLYEVITDLYLQSGSREKPTWMSHYFFKNMLMRDSSEAYPHNNHWKLYVTPWEESYLSNNVFLPQTCTGGTVP